MSSFTTTQYQILVLFNALLFAVVVHIAEGQLASVYSDVSRSEECASWSSWGPCIWPNSRTRSSYTEQLSPVCRQHWFFQFLSARYQAPLDQFFHYFLSVMKSTRPCGMCSYRQSCGFGGPRQCDLSPFEVQGGRSILPFYVAERVCNSKDLKGLSQTDACHLDYDMLKQNGGECMLWPTPKVNLDVIEPGFREQIINMKWYTCATQIKRNKYAKFKTEKICRCCCYPFKPNPQTFVCEHIPGAEPAPGFTRHSLKKK